MEHHTRSGNQLLNLLLSQKSKQLEIDSLTEAINNLSTKLELYQEEQKKTSIVITKIVSANRLLEDKNKKLENSIRHLEQYSRRNNIEIIVIEGRTQAQDEQKCSNPIQEPRSQCLQT